MRIKELKTVGQVGGGHWCLKSVKIWFAKAIVACLKNLDVLSMRIDAQKWMHRTLQDTKENVWLEAYSGLQTYMVTRYLRLIWKAYSHKLLKLQ